MLKIHGKLYLVYPVFDMYSDVVDGPLWPGRKGGNPCLHMLQGVGGVAVLAFWHSASSCVSHNPFLTP